MAGSGKMGFRNTKAAKLTPSQVVEIRTRYEEGETQAHLSRVFGVGVQQIGRIVRGEAWQGKAPAEVRRKSPEEIAQSVWGKIQTGEIVQGQGGRKEELEKPENWSEGLTEDEFRLGTQSIANGVDCWVARETLLNNRKIMKGE